MEYTRILVLMTIISSAMLQCFAFRPSHHLAGWAAHVIRRGNRAFHGTTILYDSRRRKKPRELDLNSEDGFDRWEFGSQHFDRGEAEKKKTKKRRRVRNDDDQEEGGENGGEVDLREEDDIKDVKKATEVLSRFCTEARLARLREISNRRTQHTQFVFENTANANNLWACLRSLDAFGVQYAHVITNPEEYTKPHRMAQAKSAMGTQKWLSLKEYRTTKECVEHLKAQGFRVLASDLKPGTHPTPVAEVDWAAQKTAVVMGNEERGITDEMRELCDGTYQIPMLGFAESFNLSVATAVALGYLSSLGGLKHGDLPQEEKDKLVLRWLIKSVPGGAAILRREGLLEAIGEDLTKPLSATIMGYKMR